MVEMEKLDCQSIFWIYEPLKEYHTTCPQVLVVCSGAHTHPIPSPHKTPPTIWHTIFICCLIWTKTLLILLLGNFWGTQIFNHSWRMPFPTRAFLPLATCTSHCLIKNTFDHILNRKKIKAFPEGTGWQGKWVSISLCWVFNWSCHRTITSQRRTRLPTTKGGDLYPCCSRAWLFGVSCAWGGCTEARGWRCSLSCHLHKPWE